MARPIRVGLLITELGIGGAEKALALLALGLPPDEFEVYAACLFGPEPMGTRLRAGGVPVDDLRMTSRLDLRVIGRCRSWMRLRRLEILHSFMFHANLVARLAAGAGTPRIVSSQRIAGMEPRLRRILDRATQGRVSRYTAVSGAVARYLIESVGIPIERIEVIRIGLDLGLFDEAAASGPIPRSDLGVPAEAPLVGTVGQIRKDRQKGYPVLVEAMRILCDRSPVVILACGDGPGRAEVEAMVADRGLRDRFRLLGQRLDVPAFLRSIDIYVQASRWEGLPNAILEAMAAGRPVVATAVGGVPEVVVGGETGILVPPGRPVELAEAILSLVQAPGRAREMGEAGRRRVEKEFSAASMIDAHRRLYRRLL